MGQKKIRNSKTNEGQGGGKNEVEVTMTQIYGIGHNNFRNSNTTEGDGGGHNQGKGTMSKIEETRQKKI